MKVRALPIVFLLVLVAGLLIAEPPSWPQWRGPNGNGVSPETDWNPNCLEGGAKVLWNADIGTGYSNVAISRGQVYAVGSGGRGSLLVSCLAAASGAVIWQQRFPLGASSMDPESTPAVDGERLYGVAPDGTLFCLDTADGRTIWRKRLGRFNSDIQAITPSLRATSLVVEGDILLVNANVAGLGLDKYSGRVAWDSGMKAGGPVPDAPFCQSCSTPLVAGTAGARTALFLGPTALSAVDAGTGKVRWSFAHSETLEEIGDPVVAGDTVFFSSTSHSYALGLNDGRELWSNDHLRGQIATPVFVRGFLFGSDWDRYLSLWEWHPVQEDEWNFRCIDVKTGRIAWSRPMKWMSVISASGKLIMLDAKGNLTIAEASPNGFRPLSSADALAGANRPRLFPTPPALCDGKIYVRNYAGDLICIDARK
jgi:outer membrane protein assembly factor BamB